MIARTTFGRSLAVALSVAVSQLAGSLAQAATPHVVDAQQMASRLAARAAEREAQVKLVENALDTAVAQKQAGAMGLNVGKLRAAVPHLSDTELQDLSQRAGRVNDVAAGHGTDDGLVIVAAVLLLAGLAILVAVGGYDDGYYDDCGCYY